MIADGNNSETQTVRPNLFRSVAVDAYQGPMDDDVPFVLTPWRPGLLWAAGLIGFCVVVVWLIP